MSSVALRTGGVVCCTARLVRSACGRALVPFAASCKVWGAPVCIARPSPSVIGAACCTSSVALTSQRGTWAAANLILALHCTARPRSSVGAVFMLLGVLLLGASWLLSYRCVRAPATYCCALVPPSMRGRSWRESDCKCARAVCAGVEPTRQKKQPTKPPCESGSNTLGRPQTA